MGNATLTHPTARWLLKLLLVFLKKLVERILIF